MSDAKRQIELLQESGYSLRAIEYFMNRLHVGRIARPSVRSAYTGPCGDTMEFSLSIRADMIADAGFEAIGCAGSFVAGSALVEMILGRDIEYAASIDEEQVMTHLGAVPEQKKHCICLAKRTLRRALAAYRAGEARDETDAACANLEESVQAEDSNQR
ncbi:MAG: iron-sulfur cluster assembly scaffold protein [Chitinivibrionales bacterium]|nr:iron-sulfur cluster assembly scaffold protein [Chitinivibrionales bacterium]